MYAKSIDLCTLTLSANSSNVIVITLTGLVL